MTALINRNFDPPARVLMPTDLQGDLSGVAIHRREVRVALDVIPHYWRVQMGADIEEVVECRESTVLVTDPVVISSAKNVWALSIPACQ